MVSRLQPLVSGAGPVLLGLLTLAVGLLPSRGQYVDLWQSQTVSEGSPWLPTLKYIKTDVEAERDLSHSSLGGVHQEFDRLYVAPAVGIGWNYYVYHPYLLTYSLLFEPGYTWRFEGPPGAMRETDDLVLNGNLTVNILQRKPYATSLFYNRARNEVKYDLFSSAIVDSEGWGASTGYREGPVPVTATFQQSHENSVGFDLTTITDQNLLDVRGRNERAKDSATELIYQFGQFDRENDYAHASYRNENSYQRVSLIDTEHFRKSTLRSTVLFYETDSGGLTSSDLNATLNYDLQHNSHLRSFENYSLSVFSGDSSDSIQNYATAGVQHQLYESLTSGLELHGSTLNSSSGSSTLDGAGVGVSGSLEYSKRLGTWGRLVMGDNLSYSLNGQESSGSELLIPNEAHIVPLSGFVRLNHTRATALISVTDANGNPLTPGLDYILIQSTEPWQVQVLSFGPSHIQPGAVILVTYTVQTNPSGTFNIAANQAHFSLRFWKERVELFVRYYFTDSHTTSKDFLLEDDEELQTGAEFNWKGLVLHGDYTDHNSTLYDFHGFNVSENYSANVSGDSTLGIDLNQQWSTYHSDNGSAVGTTQRITLYNFMMRYDWHPSTHLNWRAEAGYRQEQGLGLDQNLFAVRTYLNWSMGKVQVRLGYEHDDQDLSVETRKRDFAFLRLRRSF